MSIFNSLSSLLDDPADAIASIAATVITAPIVLPVKIVSASVDIGEKAIQKAEEAIGALDK